MSLISRFAPAVCLAFLACQVGAAGNPLSVGLKPGKRPGPYTSLVSVGAERGTSHCYICEAEDKPIVIIFARSLSDPLGKLVQEIDGAVLKNKEVQLRAWCAFLREDQEKFDSQVVSWAKQNAVRQVPLGIYPDSVGPPTYLVGKEADVTVVLSVKENVVASFAFRQNELNDKSIAEIVKTLPRIIKAEK